PGTRRAHTRLAPLPQPLVAAESLEDRARREGRLLQREEVGRLRVLSIGQVTEECERLGPRRRGAKARGILGTPRASPEDEHVCLDAREVVVEATALIPGVDPGLEQRRARANVTRPGAEDDVRRVRTEGGVVPGREVWLLAHRLVERLR